MFINRTQAGIQLAQQLKDLRGPDTIVLAIPRGGLPIGAAISEALDIPLGVVLSKKIGHPNNREYAIGAVSPESVVLDQQAGTIPRKYIEKEIARIRNTLKEREQMYYRNGQPPSLKNRVVIITDDGIATGNTMLTTIELVHHQSPAKIILAIPVAPASAIEKLKNSPYVDQIICLEVPRIFHAVGSFYDDFEQVTDRQAIAILETSRKDRPSSP